jgi:hypothetical protein
MIPAVWRLAPRPSHHPTPQHIDDKRHLLRLWLSPLDARPLPEQFTALWGGVEPGARGGVGFVTGPEGGYIPLEAECGQLQI